MKIEHIGVYTNQLVAMKDFYCAFFKATANKKYANPAKGFKSYFLSFEEGCRLEIMQSAKIPDEQNYPSTEKVGIAHFAASVGSAQAVDDLTDTIENQAIRLSVRQGQPAMAIMRALFLTPTVTESRSPTRFLPYYSIKMYN